MGKVLLEITLKAGLCNKLYCLFSACQIAIKNDIQILEPFFGWDKRILFSEIYDMFFFNEQMKSMNNGKNIMISRDEYIKQKSKYILKKNMVNLWKHAGIVLAKQREKQHMSLMCMNIVVLNALKLNKVNKKILDLFIDIENRNGLHMRVESDWVIHTSKKTNIKDNELYLINSTDLIDLYKDKYKLEDIFFTTGENQKELSKGFEKQNIDSKFMFVEKMEYEINAAINFELCCRAKRFIGISRSTFSNLITLKRFLNGKNESFIYNLRGSIYQRIDKGLYPNPLDAVNINVLVQ